VYLVHCGCAEVVATLLRRQSPLFPNPFYFKDGFVSSTPCSGGKKEYEGEYGYGARWEARRALQLKRDLMIMQVVDHLDVVTPALLVALLGLDCTPSSLASIGRRLRRFADVHELHLVTQFDPVVHRNVTYAVTKELNPRQRDTRQQLAHKLMIATFWASAEAVYAITDRRKDRELRSAGGLGISGIVPDGICRIGSRIYVLECNGGRDHFEQVVAKAEKYHRHRAYIQKDLYEAAGITVVWVSKLKGRVEHMVDAFSKIDTDGIFKICAEEDFFPAHLTTATPFHPLRLTEPIFVSPKDRQKHPLVDQLCTNTNLPFFFCNTPFRCS
jgi:hypothetical protein